jgi:hypothetical protein
MKKMAERRNGGTAELRVNGEGSTVKGKSVFVSSKSTLDISI